MSLNPALFKGLSKSTRPDAPVDATPKIRLAIPSGRGSVGQWTISACCQAIAHSLRVVPVPLGNSSLTHNFNICYADAYNGRRTEANPDGYTHFVLLHDDIQPVEIDWIERLYNELVARDLDVLSVIVPIKDGRGITSTAFDTCYWQPRRLTIWELLTGRVPGTFTNEDIPTKLRSTGMKGTLGNLLINTGLMILRLDRPWSNRVCFQFRNEVYVKEDGSMFPVFEPEDWRFSRFLAQEGARYGATNVVSAIHYGQAAFRSDHKWGDRRWDMDCIQETNMLYEQQRLEGSEREEVGKCPIPRDHPEPPVWGE